ncbi:putative HTH-type transcriptional regulator YdjF [Sporomusa acidovorans DSM 3132]|uniref:HTH-type transcriptional regulator YdjF n=2 Tax=Sporomusa TaxID=2375 RepID=A0ABZ3J9U6_SPOA4|nr:glycerol-3-phosphate regulon repressor [Sporomusa acidovorans DSM 3132]SDE32466.1 transcriptional regulator, DeoR family [Sporomusa acidovorans]
MYNKKKKFYGVLFMLGLERRRKIMEQLTQDRKVYVADLSRKFQVTEETIRRDLEKLEQQNLLQRNYGGAVLNEHTSEDISFIKRTSINNADKEFIAQKAEYLINDGDTLMVDASTTCLALLQRLKTRNHLTIITNSIRLVNEFVNSSFTIISSGGILRASSYALTGPAACSILEKYYVDLAIISCKGIDRTRGIMESNEPESLIKQAMIKQAKKSILLADYSKFDKTAFIKTCDFAPINYIVTNKEPSAEWLDFFSQHQIKLIY